MGWKAVKQYLATNKFVHIKNGSLCFGSGMLSEWLTLTPNMTQVVLKDHPLDEELRRIQAVLQQEPEKIRALWVKEDSFEQSLPVYTYQDGEIVELQCEQYNWPNVAHTGELMFNNEFFQKKDVAIEHTRRNLEIAVHYGAEGVSRIEKDLEDAKLRLTQTWHALNSLNTKFPRSQAA